MTATVLSPLAYSRQTTATYSLRPPRGLALALLIAAGIICPLIAPPSQAALACRITCHSNVPARPLGYASAYNVGYNNGYNSGYNAGYIAGNTHALAVQYNTGYDYSFSGGYSGGYPAHRPTYRPVRY
ncbi:hypothetical protein [Pseudomonas asplenii]|uniref:hypothetical protein n=1 Tax=Pseudomonas asplenii TaxID=53407 RepID=UPI002360CE24|nr:hypothetical protein [Pseudomonas asplenii]